MQSSIPRLGPSLVVGVSPTDAPPGTAATILRVLGALALLVVGGVHYQQYHYESYSLIPTVGPLFLANSVAAVGLGLYLLSPVRVRGRVGLILDRLAALAGVGVSSGAFVALLISEQTPLFGFTEHGYRFAVVLALASEALASAALTVFLARDRRCVRLVPGPSSQPAA